MQPHESHWMPQPWMQPRPRQSWTRPQEPQREAEAWQEEIRQLWVQSQGFQGEAEARQEEVGGAHDQEQGSSSQLGPAELPQPAGAGLALDRDELVETRTLGPAGSLQRQFTWRGVLLWGAEGDYSLVCPEVEARLSAPGAVPSFHKRARGKPTGLERGGDAHLEQEGEPPIPSSAGGHRRCGQGDPVLRPAPGC